MRSKFPLVYRVSFYITVTLAVLIVCYEDASENIMSRWLPLAMILVSCLALVTVDRDPRYGLSISSSTLLSWMAILLAYLEYAVHSRDVIAPLTHWLIYLQLVKIYRFKRAPDDWWILGIGLVLVVVGAVMNRGSESLGPLILVWAFAGLWTLGLFHLARAAERGRLAEGRTQMSSPLASQEKPGSAVTTPLDAGRRRTIAAPYPHLFDPPFFIVVARVGMVTLALGGVFYLLAPRFSTQGQMGTAAAGRTSLTGFDERTPVKLGRLGTILENNDLVFSATLTDEHGNDINPDDLNEPLLWRGLVMGRYERSSWTSVLINNPSPPPARRSDTARQICQQITLEPTRQTVRFALGPILQIETLGDEPMQFHASSGTLRSPQGNANWEYLVWSAADRDDPVGAELSEGPLDREDLLTYTQISNDLRQQLQPLALQATKGGDPYDNLALARRIEAFLRDSGEFGYSLVQTRTDPSLDPVVDFLTNHRTGHCEYYATALALMLRALEIPARVVNGFKGGDYNRIDRRLYVRQKHAHAWVEALVDWPDGTTRWTTLDPTPSNEREASVRRVASTGPFAELSDTLRYIWTYYIQGFDSARQQRLIYEPLRRLMAEARQGFGMMGQAIRSFFFFPDLRSFFNWRGFVVSFLGLLALTGLLLALRRLARWIRRRLPGGDKASDAESAQIAFFRRMIALLKRLELERGAGETPLEFARRAGQVLQARVEVADIPERVVLAYYAVRHGGRPLDSSTLQRLLSDLDRLDAALTGS